MFVVPVLLLLVFTFTACSDNMSPAKTPEPRPADQAGTDEDYKNKATRFITAKYQGDVDTLLELTREDALREVENGELDFFRAHKLDRIVSFNLIKTEPEVVLVIVAVNAQSPSADIPTIYYEHLWFKKFGNEWFIIKTERDT